MLQASIYIDFGAISQIQFGKSTGAQKGSLVLKIALYKAAGLCSGCDWKLL